MKQLIYSFFITLLIVFLKIKLNLLAIALLIVLILLLSNKKLWLQLVLGLVLGLLLNPVLKPVRFENTITGIVKKRQEYSFIVKTKKEQLLVYSDVVPKRNSYISLQARVENIKPTKFGFNPKIYWNSKGVWYQTTNPKIISVEKDNMQNDYIKSWFNLLFFNEKNSITKPIYKNMQELGLAHLIVISSFHITLLYSALYFLKKKYRFLIVFLFCLFTGFGPPAQKAMIYLVFITFLPKVEKLDCLALTGFIVLLLNPWSARDYSLILTMVFSCCILLFIKSTTKLQKLLMLRIVGAYIQWLSTSALYLMNFFSIFLSPLILIAYLGVMLRQGWMLKSFEQAVHFINKVNIPFVLGQNQYMQVIVLVIIIWLIKNISLMNKSLKKPFWLLMILLLSFKIYLSQQSFVTFLNVGQGDSAVIKLKDKAYLIDVGKPGSFNKVIKPYLYKNGVSQIDNIYLSHNHQDHSGGLQDDWKGVVVKNNPCPKIINLNNVGWRSVNNSSEVLLFEFKNKVFLFTGDIEENVEKYVTQFIYKDINYLKVAHHGSKTSSSLEFLKNIYPDVAIISVGKNNYNHPSPEIINRLDGLGIDTLLTMEENHIEITL